MTTYGCDGGFVPEDVAAVLDAVGARFRAFPGYYHPSYEARAADARHQRQRDVENRVVRALVKVAGRAGAEEHAVLRSLDENRGDEDDEAARIAREHGWDDGRLIALRGLAASRGVDVETVIRAALKGELRAVVELPPAPVP